MDSLADPAVPRSQWNTHDGPDQLSPPAYPPALSTPAPSAVWSRLGRGRAVTTRELSRHRTNARLAYIRSNLMGMENRRTPGLPNQY